MKIIWKFPIKHISDRVILLLPASAQILSVQLQGNDICVWVLCSPTEPKSERTLAVYGTGHPIPEIEQRFIGTVQECNGALVWHIFEVL